MKHKFVALDGLRGIAAVAVVLFHRKSWFGGDYFFGHAYLAVDFFFILSGFVIAHAYEQKLSMSGSLPTFLRDRFFRLHPLLFAGAVLGSVVYLAEIHVGRESNSPLLPLTLAASFGPFPAFWAEIPFPVNPPTWSLFWELVINFVFALVFPYLSTRVLFGIIGVSAIAVSAASLRLSGISVGFTNAELLWGFPRVCLGFSMGVVLLRIHRKNWFPNIGFRGLPPIVLLATFCLVPIGTPFSGVYDSIVILLIYPILLLWAARSGPLFPKIAKLSGEISYPLYVLHEPVLKLLSAILILTHITITTPEPFEGILRIIVTITVAYVALRLYDEPVRQWLALRFGSKRQMSSLLEAPAGLPGAGSER